MDVEDNAAVRRRMANTTITCRMKVSYKGIK